MTGGGGGGERGKTGEEENGAIPARAGEADERGARDASFADSDGAGIREHSLDGQGGALAAQPVQRPRVAAQGLAQLQRRAGDAEELLRKKLLGLARLRAVRPGASPAEQSSATRGSSAPAAPRKSSGSGTARRSASPRSS